MSRSEAEPYHAHSESDAAMRFVSQDQEGFAKNICSKNGKPIENLLRDGHPLFVEDSKGKRFIFRVGVVTPDPRLEIVAGSESDAVTFETKNVLKNTKKNKKAISYNFRLNEIESDDQRSYMSSDSGFGYLRRIDD